MTVVAFHDRRFNGIQALRGITALFIVLEHVRFLNCGAFGVDIFFCISGFMIMFSTHKGAPHFLVRRLIRILPLYELMTAGTFLLLLIFPGQFAVSRPEPVFLVKSMLFVPFDIGGGVIQPLMRIGWTVNCELFFYVLFRLSLWVSHRLRGLVCAGLLAGVVAAAQLLPSPGVFLSFYGNPVMLEFVFGILCYYTAWGLYRLLHAKKLPRIVPAAVIFFIVSLFVALLATKPTVNILGFRRLFVWGLPAVALVLSFFVLELCCRFPTPLVRLGDISFSLYLLHYYPVTFLDRKVFDFSVCSPRSLLGVMLALAVSTALSLVSYELIEKRLTKWLLERLCGESRER